MGYSLGWIGSPTVNSDVQNLQASCCDKETQSLRGEQGETESFDPRKQRIHLQDRMPPLIYVHLHPSLLLVFPQLPFMILIQKTSMLQKVFFFVLWLVSDIPYLVLGQRQWSMVMVFEPMFLCKSSLFICCIFFFHWQPWPPCVLYFFLCVYSYMFWLYYPFLCACSSMFRSVTCIS